MFDQEHISHDEECTCDGCLVAQMRSVDASQRTMGWQAWYVRDGARLLASMQRRCQGLGCPEQCEDLVQDCFMVGFRNISSGRYVEQGRPLRAYLYGIAKHLLQEVKWLCRKESLLPEGMEEELVAATPDPTDRVVVEQVLTLVKEAYERQPFLSQHVIEGIYAGGKSSDEMAQQLNKSAGSVRNIAYRSVNDMQSYLAGRHDMHISSSALRSCLEELWQYVV